MRFVLLLIILIGLAATPFVKAQTAAPSSTPAASPAQTKKHKHKKELQAGDTTTTATTAVASPAPSAAPGSSPAPPKKRSHKKLMPAASAASPAPAVAPSPTPSNAGGFAKKHANAPSTATVASTPAPVNASKSAKQTKPVVNAASAPGGGNGLVWVNTQTHVYHKQGSRYYGKTKQGKYISEQDAITEGDRPAAKGK
jgi:hypothetical protein